MSNVGSPSSPGADGGTPVSTPNVGTDAGVPAPGGDNHGAHQPGDYRDTSEFALWDKYEAVAMHFNELIIRLRTQALGGLAGVVAISGFAVNFTQKTESPVQWTILFGTLLFFLCAWIALWILDTQYYDKLLAGAVEALLEHESKTRESLWPINLSTKIRNAVTRHERTVHTFYAFVAFGLFIGIAYTGYEALPSTPKQAKPDIVEYKIQLSTPDTLKVSSESGKVEHEIQLSIPNAVKVIAEPTKAP